MGVYKHFIFDMDGTLSDTAKATIIACNEAAKKLGLPPFSAEQVKAAMGYPGLEYYQVLLGNVKPGSHIESNIKQSFTRELLLAFQAETDLGEAREIRRIGRGMLFPGIEEILEELKGLGVELYIASTGHPDHINLLLDVTGIRPFFKSICCGRSRKVEMTGEIISTAGTSFLGDWLFVGDRHIDAEAAKGNGILAVGAGYGYCLEEERELFDIIAERPEDLLKLAK
ncbi:MAG: HAD family hydrolase [Treponema sp.]|jgi:phosphoglycolate phosphatase-like HAD superfamily hydrolase|nr:HAD family hydrolase [Treponema sp.]